MTDLWILIIYSTGVFFLVRHYYNKAHFESVDRMIHAAEQKCADNDWSDIDTTWEAYEMWIATRKPFL